MLLAAIAAAIAAGLWLTLLAARLFGWEPAWAATARHAWGEAEYRLGGTWAEFVDWARERPEDRESSR